MNPGDLVECIESVAVSYGLTLGKTYKVEAPSWLSDTVQVKNDQGLVVGYLKKRFKMSAANFIKIEGNKVEFTLQDGPIKENGVNGCQIDDVIGFVRDRIQSFQVAIPCRENEKVLDKLDESLMWLDKRRQERTQRNVEGTSSR